MINQTTSNPKFYAVLFLDAAHPYPYRFISSVLAPDSVAAAFFFMDESKSWSEQDRELWAAQFHPVFTPNSAEQEPTKEELLRTAPQLAEAYHAYTLDNADQDGRYRERILHLLRAYTAVYYQSVHVDSFGVHDRFIKHLAETLRQLLAELHESRPDDAEIIELFSPLAATQ